MFSALDKERGGPPDLAKIAAVLKCSQVDPAPPAG